MTRNGRTYGAQGVSYRSFKHLLGETSLERKCRFIFGGGIFVLVTFSFYWYGQKTETLVIGQTTQAARMLVNPTVMNLHYKVLGDGDFASTIDDLWDNLSPLDDLPRYEAHILSPSNAPDAKKKPADEFERAALERFLRSASAEDAYRKAGTPKKPYSFGDGTPMWDSHRDDCKKEYQYIQAVLFKPGCLVACHSGQFSINNHMMRQEAGGKWSPVKAGDLAGAVVVDL